MENHFADGVVTSDELVGDVSMEALDVIGSAGMLSLFEKAVSVSVSEQMISALNELFFH